MSEIAMCDLRNKFSEAIRAAVAEAHKIGLVTPVFERMIIDSHPVEVAKKLILSGKFQQGFMNAINIGRSDITVESIMLKPEFKDLFTEQELEAAQWRLNNAK